MNGESTQYQGTGDTQRQPPAPTSTRYSSIPPKPQSMMLPPEATANISSTSPPLQQHQHYMQPGYIPHVGPHIMQSSLPMYHPSQTITQAYRDSSYSTVPYPQYQYMAVPPGPYYRPMRTTSPPSFVQPIQYPTTAQPPPKRSTNPFPIDSKDNQRIQHIMQGIEDSFQTQSSKLKQPDIQTPFSTIDDVFDRLLPYHLLDSKPSLPTVQKRTDIEERTNNMIYQIGSKISNTVQSSSQLISMLNSRIILQLEREMLRSVQELHTVASPIITTQYHQYQNISAIQQSSVNRPAYLPGSIYRQVYQASSKEKQDSVEFGSNR